MIITMIITKYKQQ